MNSIKCIINGSLSKLGVYKGLSLQIFANVLQIPILAAAFPAICSIMQLYYNSREVNTPWKIFYEFHKELKPYFQWTEKLSLLNKVRNCWNSIIVHFSQLLPFNVASNTTQLVQFAPYREDELNLTIRDLKIWIRKSFNPFIGSLQLPKMYRGSL